MRMDPLCAPVALEAPSTGDRDCHLLDEQGRALCFADIAGRPVHEAVSPFGIAVTGDGLIPFCGGCGRPRCRTCLEISAEISKWRSA